MLDENHRDLDLMNDWLNQFLEPSAVNAVISATRPTVLSGVGALHGR
jgi:hypothetical protein